MDKTKVKIYVLIMLECRISRSTMSELLGLEKEQLDEEIRMKTPKLLYQQALEYLEVECAAIGEENKKGKWKAIVYLRRLGKILSTKPINERVKLLNDFITALAGPSIMFALNNTSRRYTEEEKERIIKYRLKYAISNHDMKQDYRMDPEALRRWEDELPDGDLKNRAGILREYLADKNNIPRKLRALQEQKIYTSLEIKHG